MSTLSLPHVYNRRRVFLLTECLALSAHNRSYASMFGVKSNKEVDSITGYPTIAQLETMKEQLEAKRDDLKFIVTLKTTNKEDIGSSCSNTLSMHQAREC